MRLFSLLIFVANLFYFMPPASAQQAGPMPQAGVGYYGGTQPCPYGNGGKNGQGKSVAAIELRLDQAEDELKDKEEELEDLYNISHDLYDSKTLPLKNYASIVLLKMMNPRDPQRDSLCDTENTDVQQFNADLTAFYNKQTAVCSKTADGKYEFMSFRDMCAVTTLYDTSDSRRPPNQKVLSKRCERWGDDILALEKEVDDLNEDVADLEEKLADAKYAEKKAEKYAAKYGYTIPEGQQCLNCNIAPPEPVGPTTGQLVTAGIVDVAGLYLGYRGVKYISNQNAALGWDTSPLVAAQTMGSMYPGMTARLLAASRAGQGSGSWGCSGMIDGGGYPNGASGAYGPNGIYSGYGQNVGGPFYAQPGCSYGCMPQAGGPFYPGAQMYGGIPMGPMASYPGYGIAGNPFGGAGIPGILAGSGFNGGFAAGPYAGGSFMSGGMGLYGQGPYGGMPYGGMPYGGMPYGGIAGGIGMPYGGAGYGSPFGMAGGMGMPYGGAGYGSPFGMAGGMGMPYGGAGYGVGGAAYQQQMMQMQMQAQMRALQNQQVATQQIYTLQGEYQQLMSRYNMVMQQYYSGGMVTGGYSSGSYNPYYSPYQSNYVPGSSVPNPPSGSSTGR